LFTAKLLSWNMQLKSIQTVSLLAIGQFTWCRHSCDQLRSTQSYELVTRKLRTSYDML